ncbi:MAG TPA: hypothetical protein VLT33_25680 [Labilithrix sp.]|nr:hypothetical protein [Labilithrix sp.]
MMLTLRGSLVTAVVLTISFLGCNSLLDNQTGTLALAEEAGAPPDLGTTGDAAPAADAAVADTSTAPDVVDPPTEGCPLGQHICNGVCVSLTDPVYGCGDPSCAPCPSTHGTMACAGRKCIVGSCDPGYANCNAIPGDGCEVDLSKPETCGACNATCGVATPLCAAAGSSFQCTNGCTPSAPLNCGNACVDPNTSANHCGGCNIKCPVIANSISQCTLGTCGFTCKAAFHACGAKCPAKTDPTACGPDCIVCPVPAGGAATCANDLCGISCPAPSHVCGGKCVTNDPTACGAACTACAVPANAAAATCAAETCGFTCSAGFGNCDANAANGCEATLATDPLNCGVCGKSCGAQTCVAGVCQAPPPP